MLATSSWIDLRSSTGPAAPRLGGMDRTAFPTQHPHLAWWEQFPVLQELPGPIQIPPPDVLSLVTQGFLLPWLQ